MTQSFGRSLALVRVMLKSNPQKPTLLWAVYPFSEDKDILKSAAWCLRALVKSSPSLVQPVFIWMNPPLERAVDSDPSFLENLEKKGQVEMEVVLNRIKIPGIQPLRVIASNTLTVREMAKELVDYAKKMSAELILVSSHGRKGVKRWMLGSFAETLSLYSDVPLLTVHPNWKRIPEFNKILFPTDFSDESKEAFTHVLDFAEKQKSRIILFNKSNTQFYPAFDIGFAILPDYEQAFADENLANIKMAKEMSEQAKTRGLRVDVVFDHTRTGSTSEAILKKAKQTKSIIALASHSGPLTSVLMGSTTRQVVRYSEQPVWVIHPKEKKLPKETQVRSLYTDLAARSA